MKLLVKSGNKLIKYELPNKVEESYLVRSFSEEEENIITIIGENEKWVITNANINLSQNGSIIERKVLGEYEKYEVSFPSQNEKYIIYCLPSYENSNINVLVDNNTILTIGSSNDNTIVYNNSSGNNVFCELKKVEDKWFLESKIEDVFVNGKMMNSCRLIFGDTIFIDGLKLIWMGSFFRINNPNNLVKINNLKGIKVTNDNSFSDISEKEKNIELYNENDCFFHTPQLKFSIKNQKIYIDQPPAQIKNEEPPVFLTLGSSIVMALTSVITGIVSISNIYQGTATFKDSILTISISISMCLGCILFPILLSKYQKKKNKKKELLRQTKYTEYLNSKKSEIEKIISSQSKILNDNYLSLEQYKSILKDKDKKIWSSEIKDDDFLTVRLGFGNKRANLDIDAPVEHFSLDDDNLKTEVLKLSNNSLLMTDVPVTVSLTENRVFPIILGCSNKVGYINGLLLQLMTLNSSMDLKIVFFIDKKNEEIWKPYKYLAHSISNDKSKRFYATNEEEMKKISSYLEQEYNDRKEQDNDVTSRDEVESNLDKGKYYKNYSPYYLIITDNFKMAMDIPIVGKIMKTNANYGFSLLMFESTMKNIPSKCNWFANIVDNNSGLFSKDLSSNSQSSFKAEYLTDASISDYISLLSNIPISTEVGESLLPASYEFLQMFEVGKLEQLNLLTRWSSSNPTVSLSTPIGVYPNKNNFELDLHEKQHGPHGLVAGMTGSGKSEFIITYILSMAINYHPYEVQFVLIDYKGGGLAGAFENREKGIKLPHLVGTITNLDVSEMNRTLVSIRSELKRRQKKFNEVKDELGISTIDIYKYQSLYREGKIKEPISHLFIISDEFAELKANQPEFMDELISTARIGRSLGVHLILATQKPSGVVNDQIWSNTRFRICLKVQSSADSIEMLKKPDAAKLVETGRFYLQVGYDELFEMGQAAWAGAKYIPNDKPIRKRDDSVNVINNVGDIVKSIDSDINNINNAALGDQLTNIVKYIYNVSVKENINLSQLWLPSIPDEIFITNTINKYNYRPVAYNIEAIMGEYDDPENQIQNILTLNLTNNGNTCIFGISGSGKENLVSTIIYSLCLLHTPREVNFYILDFGATTLKIYSSMPHVGDVVTVEDADKVYNLFLLLKKELDVRKELFSSYNGNYAEYCKLSGKAVPLIIVTLISYETFLENFDDYEGIFELILREGSKYGIEIIMTATSQSSIRSKTLQFFNHLIGLQLADAFDYKYYLNAPTGLVPKKVFGRGVSPVEDGVYEFQTASVSTKDKINETILALANALTQKYDYKAPSIPMIPKALTFNTMIKHINTLMDIPLGVNKEKLVIEKFNLTKNRITQITGNKALNLPFFITELCKIIYNLKGVDFKIFDPNNCIDFDEDIHITYSIDEEISALKESIETNSEIPKVFAILGIKNLFDNISEESKEIITDILENVNKYQNIYFIICDNYSSYKKFLADTWYTSSVDTSSGIWVGEGVNVQVAINLNDLDNDFGNLTFEGLCFLINDGEVTAIKGLGDYEI